MKTTRQYLSLLLSLALVSPLSAGRKDDVAEEHVVQRTELRQSLGAAAESRAANLAQFDRLLSKSAVRTTLNSARIDAGKVRQAAAMLSSDELSRLAARSSAIERDLAAGALTNQQLTYIVIALATALIVTLIFVAS